MEKCAMAEGIGIIINEQNDWSLNVDEALWVKKLMKGEKIKLVKICFPTGGFNPVSSSIVTFASIEKIERA